MLTHVGVQPCALSPQTTNHPLLAYNLGRDKLTGPPINSPNSASKRSCMRWPSLVYTQLPPLKSYRTGPLHFGAQHSIEAMFAAIRVTGPLNIHIAHLSGDDSQICWLGACLFITYVPLPISVSVSTPCCSMLNRRYESTPRQASSYACPFELRQQEQQLLGRTPYSRSAPSNPRSSITA
jgi:hypothetical protein